MKPPLILLLAGLACVGSAAPGAQTGQQGPAPSAPEDLRRFHDYTRCIAQTRPQRVRELLAMDFRGRPYRDLAERLYRPEPRCWNRLGEAQRSRALRVQFSRRMFAGGLAEAMLRSDLAGSRLADRVAFDAARAPLAARTEEEMVGLCTVRAAPAEVAAILATEPASPEEAAAIRAVTPRIGACLTAGATGEFNRPAIRSMLALGAYRLVQQNMAQPAAVSTTQASPETAR